MKYSVLTYNIGGYEKIKDIKVKSNNAEYICVTDDRTFTSNTWTVKYVDNPHKEDNFFMCYDIRFNPFKYVNTDVVLRIDGSMEIVGNTDDIYNKFEEGQYDMMLCIHPQRNTMREEYYKWITSRGYNQQHAEMILKYMQANGYDIDNYKGLYQGNIVMQRNNEICNSINKDTYDLLIELKEDGKMIERVNQTILSYVINTKYQMLKVLPVSNNIAFSDYFHWYKHNSDQMLPIPSIIDKYLFNNKIETFI